MGKTYQVGDKVEILSLPSVNARHYEHASTIPKVTDTTVTKVYKNGDCRVVSESGKEAWIIEADGTIRKTKGE